MTLKAVEFVVQPKWGRRPRLQRVSRPALCIFEHLTVIS